RTYPVVHMATPFDVGIFVALCCATPSLSIGHRTRVIAIGSLLLFALDCGVAIGRFLLAVGVGPQAKMASWLPMVMGGILDTTPLLARVALWFTWIGRRAVLAPALARAN